MNENEKSYYFSIIKLICIIILIIYYVSSGEKSLHNMSVEWFFLAVTLSAALCFELFDTKRIIFLIIEIALTVMFIVIYKDSNNGLFLLPMAVMDTVVFFRLSFAYGFLSFLGVFINDNYFFIYIIYCLFIMIIYFQNYIVIEKYRRYLEDNEKEEYHLKDSITFQDAQYKEQLEKSSLSFENKMLEEKARLSQALHDKLGHSINGSIYQLEACKVLMEKDTKESNKIVQAVIDNLRTSMDEIRSILRREKPDKKRMAYLQLLQLCADCKEKYDITAEVKLEGEDKEIPEILWDVILDNTIEAVTNALKYSQCTKLLIEIIILHKVVRCSITDNGIGCNLIKEGMGIQGMKNRARQVNGYIDISSNNGFRINMIIPLEK